MRRPSTDRPLDGGERTLTAALDLGESIELLDELVDQMDTEDGVIWIYGTDEDSTCALSPDGIECL